MEYLITDKYALRAGYYPQYFTCGLGIDFYSFTIDYAADFSKIDIINRLRLTYRWKFVKSYELIKESENALNKQMIDLKNAEKV
ncbi:MAG: hypothetical protein LBS81_02615 [Endomicrobium sp.]|jgi:hypothetical protein|nr:hypothetical protein [Endomicrobium sp.]